MFLGLDLGTSGLKAVLVDEGQAVVSSATAPLTVSRPHPGWSEQDPAQWWSALEQVLDVLKARHPAELAAVRGIGLSGQQHGAVLLDADDRVLRPCILWNDTRASAECAALEAAWPDLRRVAGNIAMPGFTAPKLLWLRAHEPEIFSRTARVLLPKAWLRLALTGEAVEEMSDASGTLWLDVAARAWSVEALAATGLPLTAMPRLVEGSGPAGSLRPDLAQAWGMTTPPLFAGGAGDNAAGAVGLGAIRPGDAFVSLGTSGVLFATTDGAQPYPEGTVHAFCHALPGLWHQMGVTLSAAASLAWWAGIAGTDEASLVAEIGRVERPSAALFLPYLAGERTPHNDGAVRGAFAGLSAGTDRPALTQAVMEGVAFSLRDCLDAVRASGTRVEAADVIGGGSRSRAWIRILASVLDIPLSPLAEGEHGGAFGAARLARLAVTGEAPETICTPPERGATVLPDRSLAEAYAERLSRYRGLYPALRALAG
ncbi:xylulokinase [Methylobacterium frigidaeris]|uniref:Xylulose kinase n=2 Tax=Methylobacterium frigidaeris TaxID=2038277 RepID=A0AA37HEP6_9HYPH|nr:xylulokinase [Methylobacterium frigidaeris]PIK73001.1 xylulokinase [Methylobacterium frigidaeris]GJD64647.1 Xylulose kinase [Methylobacterium frigidaeris]